MSEELNPCPYCGSHGLCVISSKTGSFWVWCTTCEATSSTERTREDAIEAWNRVSAGLNGRANDE